MKLKKYSYAAALLLCYSPDGSCMKPTGGDLRDELRAKLLEQERILSGLQDSANATESDAVMLSIRLGNIKDAYNTLNKSGQLSMASASRDLPLVLGQEQLLQLIKRLRILDINIAPQMLADIHAKFTKLECIIVSVEHPIHSELFEQDEASGDAKWLYYKPVGLPPVQVSQPVTKRQDCNVF